MSGRRGRRHGRPRVMWRIPVAIMVVGPVSRVRTASMGYRGAHRGGERTEGVPMADLSDTADMADEPEVPVRQADVPSGTVRIVDLPESDRDLVRSALRRDTPLHDLLGLEIVEVGEKHALLAM